MEINIKILRETLVKQGLVDLAPDTICFEKRRVGSLSKGTNENAKDDEWNHFLELCHGILTGQTLAKTAIEDALGEISVLNGIDIVDKERIGCMGHSYGGNTTLFVTALDARISYALASGSVESYKHHMEARTGIELSSIIPNFLKQYEIVDLVKLICPRDFMIIYADEDKYSKDARKIFNEALPVYIEENAQNNLCIKEFSGGHSLTNERFDFIVDWIINQNKKDF